MKLQTWLPLVAVGYVCCTMQIRSVCAQQQDNTTYPTESYLTMMSNDTLLNADIWDLEPKIFTANYAFEGIEGVENLTQTGVEAAGGTWLINIPQACENITFPVHTTANTPSGVASNWGWPTYYADAMPVVFSWPVKTSSVHASQYELTLNTGRIVNPDVASITPNAEWNERSTIVVFGHFGNRISPGMPGAEYVTRVRIVDNGHRLFLIGPGGKMFDATGLEYDASCCPPYGKDAKGPTLVAAKLSHFSAEGEYTSTNGITYPNDCQSLYGEDAKYRLRMYTSGGFSPDGVSAMDPTEFSKFFRIHVSQGKGEPTIELERTGVLYDIPRYGRIQVLGLADLGISLPAYGGCYMSDADNYIDVCLKGDEKAIRQIIYLEMPYGNKTADPTGRFKPLYNPGGPGNNPAPGVNYTSPNPYLLQPVRMALDDPMTVTYIPPAK